MTRMIANEHDWFRRHLPDHLLDLLADGDRRRFDAHARGCATCARVLARAEGARPDWWDGAGHPPVALLLEWDASPGGGATREAVRAHLAHCEDCRRDLEELRGPGAASSVALAPVPGAARERPSAPASRPRWHGPGALAAALAAVLVLVLAWPRATGRGRAPAPAGGESPATGRAAEPGTDAPPAPPAPAPSPARSAVAEPVALAAAERGGPAAVTVVDLAPGVEHVPLTLPALAAPDGVMMEITLRDSAGAPVVHQVLAADRALRPGGVVLPAERLATGRYALSVRWVDPVSGETSRRYPLDVRVSREP